MVSLPIAKMKKKDILMNKTDGNKNNWSEIRKSRILMAAPCSVILRGRGKRLLEQAALDVFFSTEEYEKLISRFLPDSEICILNDMAANEPVRVQPDVFELLFRCRQYYEWSDRAFDITAAPLLELWDISGRGRRPAEKEIEETLEIVGMDKVLFEEPTRLMAFEKHNMQLDLGGVGKGAALDRAVELLRTTYPVKQGFVSFGRSTIGAIGGPWSIELTNPLDESQAIMTVEITDEMMSMSTTGPRRFLYKAYEDADVDHIIDPRTGKAHVRMVNVAVTADKAETADALTTALVLEGEENALRIAQNFGAKQVIFIRPEGGKFRIRKLDVAHGTWEEDETDAKTT